MIRLETAGSTERLLAAIAQLAIDLGRSADQRIEAEGKVRPNEHAWNKKGRCGSRLDGPETEGDADSQSKRQQGIKKESNGGSSAAAAVANAS